MRRVVPFGSLQQWLIGILLTAALLSDMPLFVDTPFFDEWWIVPGGAMMFGPALLVSRWPVGSGVAAVVVMVGWATVLELVGARMSGPVSGTVTLAVTLMILVVVRENTVRTAVALSVLLAVGEITAMMLHGWWETSFWNALGLATASMAIQHATGVGIGLYLRGRDRAAAQATRTAVAAARQRERVDLARELHDVVAHYIGGIVVQAQAAQVVAGADAGAGTRVLPMIEGAGVEALSAMRRMVSVLRDDDLDAGVPTRTTDLVADLRAVTAAMPGGTPVRLTVEMTDPIPAEVATSVLRLVQESVTNARRHATGANEISVTVRSAGGVVQVQVDDDGRGGESPKRYGGGFGLVGMRERAQLLGGQFSAGRRPGGGWRVVADMPL